MDDYTQARKTIDAAIARRRELFFLSHLAVTTEGCTLKFRSGFVDITRSAVPESTINDPASFDKLLDGIRVAFRGYNPVPAPPRRGPTY